MKKDMGMVVVIFRERISRIMLVLGLGILLSATGDAFANLPETSAWLLERPVVTVESEENLISLDDDRNNPHSALSGKSKANKTPVKREGKRTFKTKNVTWVELAPEDVWPQSTPSETDSLKKSKR